MKVPAFLIRNGFRDFIKSAICFNLHIDYNDTL